MVNLEEGITMKWGGAFSIKYKVLIIKKYSYAIHANTYSEN